MCILVKICTTAEGIVVENTGNWFEKRTQQIYSK